MDKIDQFYLVSIDRSGCFRRQNINRLKLFIKHNFNKELITIGVDSNHVYNNPDRIREFQSKGIFLNNKNWFKCGGGKYRPFKQGEVGCYLSHFEIWSHMIKNNVQKAIIFEDDSLIEPHTFIQHVNDIMNNLPDSKYYISLYHSPQRIYIKRTKNVNPFLKKINFDLWGTVSYIVNLDMAKDFIEKLIPLKYPVDQAIAGYCVENSCLYLSDKPLVKLCDSQSIIR